MYVIEKKNIDEERRPWFIGLQLPLSFCLIDAASNIFNPDLSV